MLTLTDSAATAIRTLITQPDLPEETGLRIMKEGDGAPSFQLALTEGPAAGDQVVESAGARVFVGPEGGAGRGEKAPEPLGDGRGGRAVRHSARGRPA